jgi:hypothetical protein
MIDTNFLPYFDNMINNQDILNFNLSDIEKIDKKSWEVKTDELKIIFKDDEVRLNFIWTQSKLLDCFYLFLSGLSNLKYGNLEKGYNDLDRVDIEGTSLIKILDQIYLDSKSLFIKNTKIDKLVQLAQTYMKLFVFDNFISLSPEIEVIKSNCSICGEFYKLTPKCEHKVGKLYMGKMCCRVISEFNMPRISIVNEPKNKYSRGWGYEFKGQKFHFNYSPCGKFIKDFISNIKNPYTFFTLENSYLIHNNSVKHFEVTSTGRDIFERPIQINNSILSLNLKGKNNIKL